MKRIQLLAVAVPLLTFQTACDNITGLDNRDAPESWLSGRVVFEGEPVGVRSNAVQLELWEPKYQDQLYQKIPVHIDQDGTFKASLFDGDYKLNLLPNNGPWVNRSDTTLVSVRGEATVDVPVTPYFVVRSPSFTRGAPTQAVPGGTITGTFSVGQIAPSASRQVEYVGLYVGLTSFVDRTNTITSITAAQRERARSVIQTQLNTNGTISITVNLPATIFQTQSPALRKVVYARIGIKTTGVTELLFSPVVEITL